MQPSGEGFGIWRRRFKIYSDRKCSLKKLVFVVKDHKNFIVNRWLKVAAYGLDEEHQKFSWFGDLNRIPKLWSWKELLVEIMAMCAGYGMRVGWFWRKELAIGITLLF